MITQRNIIVTDEVFSPVTAVIEACSSETIVIPPTPSVITNDGILRPRLMYMNGYDTGAHQSLQREMQQDFETQPQWDYVAIGGANGKGYIRSIQARTNGGQFITLPAFSKSNFNISWPQQTFGDVEELITGADKLVKMNLFGIPLTAPLNFSAFYWNVVGFIAVQVYLRINTDYTVQAFTMVGPVGPPSTIKVPANGWFGINWQAFIAPFGNPLGGFVIANLHISETDIQGTPLLRNIGVDTYSHNSADTINGYGWGTEVVPGAGKGISGIGFDDIHISGNYGNKLGFFGQASVDMMLPSMMGDKIESIISHDGRRLVETPLRTDLVGLYATWGVADRTKNLLGIRAPLDDYLSSGWLTPPLGHTELLIAWIGGWLGAATHNWVTGPWGFAPYDDPGEDMTPGPHQPDPDIWIRNTLYTGPTGPGQMDLYKIPLPRSEAKIINGVSIFSINGNVTYTIRVDGFGFWNMTADADEAGFDINHVYDSIIKFGSQIVVTRSDFNEAIGLGWKTVQGYMRNPWSVQIADPSGQAITPDSFLTMQIGLQNNIAIVEHFKSINPDFYTEPRTSKTDYVMLGLEYSYRSVEHIMVAPPSSRPIAKIVTTFDPDTRHIVARDASTSWNTTIVSRVIDWGDGSSTEVIAASSRLDPGSTVILPTLNHTYAVGGTYHASVTVTDNLGQVVTDTFIAVVTFRAPVASFNIDSAPGSTSINFINGSSDADNDIVRYDWNFGDGSPISHVTSPTHNYAIAGTYTVSLTATDAQGLTNTATTSIIVPIPVIITGCGLTAAARTIPATAGIQADDYAGGNARFPNYLSSATLRNYVWNQIPFRALYNNGNGIADTDYELDTVETFNGRPSLKFNIFGDGYGAFSSSFSDDTTNLSDDSNFSNDQPIELWMRTIFKVNQQLVDLVNGITIEGRGFQIAAVNGSGTFSPVIFANGGHVYQQIQTRLVAEAGSTTRENIDLGVQSDIVAKNWCELITFTRYDEGLNTQRNMTWLGVACSLAGISPLCDRTNPSFAAHSGGGFLIKPVFQGIDWMYYYNAGFATFSDPKPAPNISLIEIHHGVPLASNPFGVGLT